MRSSYRAARSDARCSSSRYSAPPLLAGQLRCPPALFSSRLGPAHTSSSVLWTVTAEQLQTLQTNIPRSRGGGGDGREQGGGVAEDKAG